MAQVLANGRPIVVRDLTAEIGEDFVVHLILPEIAQCLNEGAALPAGGGHIARSGVLQDDLAPANLQLAGGAVGEEDDTGRHLLGETEHAGGVGPGGLEADGIAHDQGTGDGIGGRGDGAENGILNRVVVEAASELSDGVGGLQST